MDQPGRLHTDINVWSGALYARHLIFWRLFLWGLFLFLVSLVVGIILSDISITDSRCWAWRAKSWRRKIGDLHKAPIVLCMWLKWVSCLFILFWWLIVNIAQIFNRNYFRWIGWRPKTFRDHACLIIEHFRSDECYSSVFSLNIWIVTHKFLGGAVTFTLFESIDLQWK